MYRIWLDLLKSKQEIPQVMENKKAKDSMVLPLPFPDSEVMTNQSDIMIENKDQKTAMVIDIAVSSNSNIRKKEYEKNKAPGPEGGSGDNVESKGQSFLVVVSALGPVTPKLASTDSRNKESLEKCRARNR